MLKESDITTTIIEAIQEKKGRAVSVVDLSEVEGAGIRSFVVCEGRTPTQVGAIADSVRDYVLEHAHRKPYATDGFRNCMWIVLDYGEILVHVFLPEERKRYNLEELWSDGKITEIPDLD